MIGMKHAYPKPSKGGAYGFTPRDDASPKPKLPPAQHDGSQMGKAIKRGNPY